jgi:hypothetical protein
MMPDYGCFAIAWTSYGVMVPLIRHVFGIQPDAVNRTVVLDPHLPTGWEDVRIDDLPVGGNRLTFSRQKTGEGIEYRVDAAQDGWTFILKPEASPGAGYAVNEKPGSLTSSGIRLTGKINRVLVQSQ